MLRSGVAKRLCYMKKDVVKSNICHPETPCQQQQAYFIYSVFPLTLILRFENYDFHKYEGILYDLVPILLKINDVL